MYYCGLDLGQARDYTALAIAKRIDPPPPGPVRTPMGTPPPPEPTPPVRYELVWLERFALGTTYPTIVAKVAERMGQLALQSPGEARALVVDATGVGRPVVDLLRRERLHASMYDVTITGGDATSHDGMSWRVPKRELVSTVQVLLQGERLKVAATLPEAATLTRELLAFQVKIDAASAHDSYGAWREGTHDDLVLAVALACWAGQKLGQANARAIEVDGSRAWRSGW